MFPFSIFLLWKFKLFLILSCLKWWYADKTVSELFQYPHLLIMSLESSVSVWLARLIMFHILVVLPMPSNYSMPYKTPLTAVYSCVGMHTCIHIQIPLPVLALSFCSLWFLGFIHPFQMEMFFLISSVELTFWSQIPLVWGFLNL